MILSPPFSLYLSNVEKITFEQNGQVSCPPLLLRNTRARKARLSSWHSQTNFPQRNARGPQEIGQDRTLQWRVQRSLCEQEYTVTRSVSFQPRAEGPRT